MQFEFVWEIEKFMWHSDTMSSPTFNAGRGIWKIKLFPLGNPGSGDKKHVAVYLQVEHSFVHLWLTKLICILS